MNTVIKEWKFVSDRLMVIDIKDGDALKTVIVVYGPNDNAIAIEKEEFFECIQREIDDAHGEPIVVGDLNGRIGRDPHSWLDILGPHGEDVKNNNGERILQLCANNGMIVANSKFPHKNAHKFTREEPSRNEKSVIDYFLLKKKILKDVIDVRVKRGFEIGSDHYLLKMDLVWKVERRNRKHARRVEIEVVKEHQLREDEIATCYQEEIERMARDLDNQWNSDDIGTSWFYFKKIVTDAAALVCGKKRIGGRYKRTAWW